MASAADSVGPTMGQREECVITGRQVCREPRRCGVAGETGCRPSGGSMIRICRSGEILRVAGVAVSRRRREVGCSVAQCAGNRRVSAGKRERCVVVIEDRACPGRGVVASCAGGGETRGGVIRIGCGVVFCLMT